MKKRCQIKGGDLRQAAQAIFRIVVPGKTNHWFAYECECGKYHIVSDPKYAK